jgi:hypothetical protein
MVEKSGETKNFSSISVSIVIPFDADADRILPYRHRSKREISAQS